MALSLFDIEENAKARFSFLKSNMGEKIYQIIGTHLAKGHITEEHGIQNSVDKNGHFSQHIVKGIQYHHHFEVVDKL